MNGIDIPFAINEHFLQLKASLDYERRKFYELIILATDHGLQAKNSTTMIHIRVLDVNDNPPVFLPVPEIIHLIAPVNAHTRIFKVIASDEDSSFESNGLVLFAPNTSHPLLDVDTHNGEVFTLDRPLPVGTHIFGITAYNPGSPLIDGVTLTVVVVDDDDQPISTHVQHISYFNESHPTPFDLYEPEVTPDSGYTFSIVSVSDKMGNISLNRNTVN
jgi:hypothetical protein